MIEIKIKAIGSFKRFNKDFYNKKRIRVILDENSKLIDVLKKTNIPKEYVGLVTVNGVVAEINSELKNKDEVIIYSPIAGG